MLLHAPSHRMSDNSRVRVSIVGVVIVALFGALLARLWFLQMGAEEAARGSRRSRAATRMVQTESPRGRILDRNGKRARREPGGVGGHRRPRLDKDDPRAGARPARRGARAAVHGRAARAELQRPAPVAAEARDRRGRRARDRRASRSSSTSRTIPGTTVQKLTVRTTRNGELAAQVLGYVGEISDEQLEAHARRGYQEGETIGKDGAERAFEKRPARRAATRDGRGRPDRPAGRRAGRRRARARSATTS